MAFAPLSPDLRVCVVGAGTMGRGIAQVAAAAGAEVLLCDVRAGAAAEAVSAIGAALARLADRGRITADDLTRAQARLRATGIDDPGLSACGLVIEAILEDLDAKRALFAQLEERVSPDCVLATNTSSLSVTAIAAGCRRPERVAGLHFFNPAPVMKIVEVVPGLLTAEAVVADLVAFVRRLGHAVAVTRDTPGFLINHAGRGYATEALRIVGEGIATPADVDRVMTGAAGFRMGPFELLDLIGLDVTQSVMESLYRQFHEEPRFRPSILPRQLIAAGRLGRKAGRGFHHYLDGRTVLPPEESLPDADPMPIWIGRRNAEDAERVQHSLAAEGIALDERDRPDPASACVVVPLGEDATTAALAEKLDPARTLALDPLFWPAGRRTLMTTPATARAVRDSVRRALGQGGAPVTVIDDSPGFIAQRIIAMVVNIGCDIAQQRIASPSDIDRAVQLGLGYPAGPLGWGDKIGPRRVLAILRAMQDAYGDPRYRPSPWLARRAALDLSLLYEGP